MTETTGVRYIGKTRNDVLVQTYAHTAGEPKLISDRKGQMIFKVIMVMTAIDFAVGLFVYALCHHLFGGE